MAVPRRNEVPRSGTYHRRANTPGTTITRQRGIGTPLDYLELLDHPPGPRPARVPRADPATGWRALDDHELIHLATALRKLVWSWRMDDMLGLAATFGWEPKRGADPDRIDLDPKLGTTNGYVHGRRGVAEYIDVPATTASTNDTAGQARLQEAFAGMSETLISAFGEPTARTDDDTRCIRWEEAQTELALILQPPTVRLRLASSHPS
ncbi:DUF6301 family protein [Nocardia transvalensis]|uniref:DUF6301 family protein n=1 Tax=Nocardia transvalensis TaxID=37333 RepID=UPI003A5CD699